jgi:hypothetical protein
MRGLSFASSKGLLRVLLLMAVIALAAPALGGCGSVYYTVSANAAQSRLEQARQMGAETRAPYEYYFAREHLRQAQVEAAEASYSDAASYAETAELYAQKAIDAIQSAKKAGDTK